MNHWTFKTNCMAENCWNWTVYNPWIFSKLCSKSENFIEIIHLWIFPVQAYAEITEVSTWHSEMPVARWTTTVNKAVENFTINYFKRINASRVFNYITETFQNLWELTLHYIAFCWKIHKYYCQITYLLHVSVQNLALSNFLKIRFIKISHRETVAMKFQDKAQVTDAAAQKTSKWRYWHWNLLKFISKC